MAACKWCERAIKKLSQFEGVCDFCHDQYIVKRDFVSKNPDMPEDDVTEEELWALVNLNTDEGQRIMDARIKRVTQQIQESWTTPQSSERLVQKKSKKSVSLSPALWVAQREASTELSSS